jgi:hypothetical protein
LREENKEFKAKKKGLFKSMGEAKALSKYHLLKLRFKGTFSQKVVDIIPLNHRLGPN